MEKCTAIMVLFSVKTFRGDPKCSQNVDISRFSADQSGFFFGF